MKIVILSQYFPPDINAASYRIEDMYKALEELGHEVSVVTAEPQKIALEKTYQQPNIQRIKLKKISGKNFLSYLYNYFGFMFKSFFRIIKSYKKGEIDYLIVTSPPLFVGVSGVLAGKLKKSKVILDIRDIWPDSAVAAGMLNEKGLFYKLAKLTEKFLYRKADYITCVSNPMKEYIYKESKHEQISVLYNGISNLKLENHEKKDFNDGKIHVGYAGNIGKVQNLHVMLAALKLDVQNKIHFHLIGDGVELESLQIYSYKNELKNITYYGTMVKDKVIEKLESVDVLFLSLTDNPTFEKTIPSKLFDYLLNNKPIVTSIQGEGRKIIKELNTGLFFKSTDASSLYNALIQYGENKEMYDVNSRSNSQYVQENFSRQKIFKTYFERLGEGDSES